MNVYFVYEIQIFVLYSFYTKKEMKILRDEEECDKKEQEEKKKKEKGKKNFSIQFFFLVKPVRICLIF